MHRADRIRTCMCALVMLFPGLAGAGAVRADAVSAAQVLRAGGCGGIRPAVPPLQRNAPLDRVARDWAAGVALAAAAERSGYPARAVVGVRVSAEEGSLLQAMRRSDCTTVMEPALREVGLYRAGRESWLVMTRSAVQGPGVSTAVPTPRLTTSASAAPEPAPFRVRIARGPAAVSPVLASRALELINDVRAKGTRCGNHAFAPAPPVTLSVTLGGVAFGHAADMAQHGYFEHQDLSGQSPADRVRAVGYREKLVGENIAYGPPTVDEVVRGWLDSPDHCENIMDPRFGEMGIASAAGRTARHGLYWVQLFAEPRA